jgi:hypothetical protein
MVVVAKMVGLVVVVVVKSLDDDGNRCWRADGDGDDVVRTEELPLL